MRELQLPEGWRGADPELDPPCPLSEWRYFCCGACGIVHDGFNGALACCEGSFLPMPVAPIEEVV
jgi:hypothetical protein